MITGGGGAGAVAPGKHSAVIAIAENFPRYACRSNNLCVCVWGGVDLCHAGFM